MLVRALRERMDYEFERILRLLALLYPSRDIHNAYVGLRSGRPQVRANALEVSEHLLRPEHYRLLSPVLDPEVSHRDRLNFAQGLCRADVTSRTEALRMLLYSEDCWLSICSLHAIGELCRAELKEEVLKVRHDGDALLEETWKWSGARLAGE